MPQHWGGGEVASAPVLGQGDRHLAVHKSGVVLYQGLGTDTVSALSASGASDESISLTDPATAGTYYYGACVDPKIIRVLEDLREVLRQ